MAKKLSAVAKIWFKRIKAGTRTFDEVPDELKDDCKEYFRMDVENGVITVEQYEEYVGEAYEVEEVEE